jgi:glyoxylase-like metal-dependent hydrolase (beta-lactamase superfamily II)
VTLIGEDTVIAVVDPVRVANCRLILDRIARLDIRPENETEVVFCHHRPDHTLNAALFPKARVHDHWTIYSGPDGEDRDADGLELSPAVRLIRTPSRTAEDITTLARTDHGPAAATAGP